MHSGTLNRLREAFSNLGLDKLQDKLTGHAGEAMELASRMWEDLEARDAKAMVDTLKLKADEVIGDPKMKEVINASICRLNKLVWTSKGFDGVWIGKVDRQPRAKIYDSTILWHWGQETDLEMWDASKVSTVLDDSVFRGVLDADGSLTWTTDGDIWVPLNPRALAEEASGDRDDADLALVEETLGKLRRWVGDQVGDQQTLDLNMDEAMQALSRVAESHGEFRTLSQEAATRRTELVELKRRVKETKTAAVLVEGHQRLRAELKKLRESQISPHLQRAQKRSTRFLTRLSTDRKVKHLATELFSVAQDRLMSKWTDATEGGGMEAWVSSVRERLVGQLAAHRTMLVESLNGLQLQEIDLRQVIANSWDLVALERQLEISLVRAVQLSGLESGSGAELLEKFEGANLVARIPVVQQTYKGLLSTLSDLKIDVPSPIRKLLEAQASGHKVDADAWREAALGSLDDDAVVQGAQGLVGHGEKLLESFQKFQANQTVARVLEHLESEDVERTLLDKLHGLNAVEMLTNAEGLLTNAEAREKLVSQLKDACLDFILKILPAIHIEKVNGNDNGCDWEINDISFSDFSFKKEDVKVVLGDPTKPGDDLLRVSAWGISAHFKDLKVFVKQTGLPYLEASGNALAKVEGMSVSLAFKFGQPGARGGAGTPMSHGWRSYTGSSPAASTAARVPLGGITPSSASGASGLAASGEPMLMMSSRTVFMDSLELTFDNTGYAVIINALTYLFADVLKNYACTKIAERLDENVGFAIAGLNTALVTCAPYLKKLGFNLPSIAGARRSNESNEELLQRLLEPPPKAPVSDKPWTQAVPRLAGWSSGRPDGQPEEIDWADPGRTFAVRI